MRDNPNISLAKLRTPFTYEPTTNTSKVRTVPRIDVNGSRITHK